MGSYRRSFTIPNNSAAQRHPPAAIAPDVADSPSCSTFFHLWPAWVVPAPRRILPVIVAAPESTIAKQARVHRHKHSQYQQQHQLCDCEGACGWRQVIGLRQGGKVIRGELTYTLGAEGGARRPRGFAKARIWG